MNTFEGSVLILYICRFMFIRRFVLCFFLFLCVFQLKHCLTFFSLLSILFHFYSENKKNLKQTGKSKNRMRKERGVWQKNSESPQFFLPPSLCHTLYILFSVCMYAFYFFLFRGVTTIIYFPMQCHTFILLSVLQGLRLRTFGERGVEATDSVGDQLVCR